MNIFLYIISVNILTAVDLDEKEGEKTSGKDEDVQTNIQSVEHGQTSAKYLFNKHKPDVDPHGTHAYFALR